MGRGVESAVRVAEDARMPLCVLRLRAEEVMRGARIVRRGREAVEVPLTRSERAERLVAVLAGVMELPDEVPILMGARR